MAYKVKTLGNCIDCGDETYRKLGRLEGYLCFECGLSRAMEAAATGPNSSNEYARIREIAFLDWVKRGGVGRAKGSDIWKQSMYARAVDLSEKWGYPLPNLGSIACSD